MKFLCIICAEKVMEHMNPADADKHYDEYGEFTRAIRRSGHLLGSNRLLPPETAKTVRVRDGEPRDHVAARGVGQRREDTGERVRCHEAPIPQLLG